MSPPSRISSRVSLPSRPSRPSPPLASAPHSHRSLDPSAHSLRTRARRFGSRKWHGGCSHYDSADPFLEVRTMGGGKGDVGEGNERAVRGLVVDWERVERRLGEGRGGKGRGRGGRGRGGGGGGGRDGRDGGEVIHNEIGFFCGEIADSFLEVHRGRWRSERE
ncbi:unnamed protein product [Closterium sp. NIES-64]|nr:unnamed protein product [Closterium sp. NIES-64]